MPTPEGFDELTKAAQDEMSKWDPDRRDAVKLQGKLNYQRAVDQARVPHPVSGEPTDQQE
jgi:hypothetical protein